MRELKVGQSCWYEPTGEEGTIIEFDKDYFCIRWELGGETTEVFGDRSGIVFENSKSELDEEIVKEYLKAIENKYHEEPNTPKYNHYFKDVSNFNSIDIYRVLDLWGVTHPCLQHAAKKILVAGNRGHKDIQKDIQEAIDSLKRWKEMFEEDKEV